MVLEGIVTTLCDDGQVNVAPMGPIVDESFSQLVLRPFRSSTTYRNLVRSKQGVFHITDDVELLARAAVDRLETTPKLVPAEGVEGWILADVCRWYAFEVLSLDDQQERTTIHCRVVNRGRFRDFIGFNRAKHAVVEAAILATRIFLLPAATVLEEFERLRVMVDKTGGLQERTAFAFLQSYVEDSAGQTTFGGG